NAASQFIIHGNVNDRLLISSPSADRLGTLADFLRDVLMPRFDVVLSYDLGNGIRLEKGERKFSAWPVLREHPELPRDPRAAIETLTRYFRYCANLARLNRETIQVGLFLPGADLIAPASGGGYDTGALVLNIREWSSESLLTSHAFATCLITEN